MLRPLQIVTIALLAMLPGCASSLPMYPAAPAETILQSVAANFASITSISGPAQITLVSETGDSISLTSAVAAKLPNSLRIRAWKFDHAVFDATMIGPDLWLVPMEVQDPAAPPLPQIPSKQISRSMSLLSGEYFKSARIESQDSRSVVIVGTTPDTASIRCEIDRATRTPRVFSFGSTSADNDQIGTLRMDNFHIIALDGGSLSWPSRLTLTRGSASITIHTDQLRVNAPLAENAFKPPLRAVKQPLIEPETPPLR